MFGWLKRSKPSDAPPRHPDQPTGDGPVLAALLLDRESFDLVAAQSALAAMSIGEPTNLSVKDGILHFTLGADMVFVAPMPAPYPWSDLEGPCQTSWMWPDDNPATNLRSHQRHVLVTSIGQGDPVTRRVQLMHVLAKLARLPGVVGVYWPDATLVHFPPVFADIAETGTRDAPPLYLLVDFRIFRNPDHTYGVFTTGLATLGLMEMEIPSLPMQPGELRDWSMNIAAYMLDRRAPIPHGDTLGATETEKLRVTHTASSYGAKGTVLRLG